MGGGGRGVRGGRVEWEVDGEDAGEGCGLGCRRWEVKAGMWDVGKGKCDVEGRRQEVRARRRDSWQLFVVVAGASLYNVVARTGQSGPDQRARETWLAWEPSDTGYSPGSVTQPTPEPSPSRRQR